MDAISNDVLGMYSCLRSQGYDVQLYGENIAYQDLPIFSTKKIITELMDEKNILIYHFSVSWKDALDILKIARCRKIIRYHNITPAMFFENISRSYEMNCREGREELGEIIKLNCDLYLGASQYNCQELIDYGLDSNKCHSVPPFHPVDELKSVSIDENILAKYNDGKTNLLMVGRIAPNKGYNLLIDSFATYYYNYNKECRLILVGFKNILFKTYVDALYRKIRNYNLEDSILFTDSVGIQALKTYYQLSHIFIITSDHEGFCVPLIEAMSMKIPILAYNSSAIPETLGDGGILWEDKDPFLFAGSIHYLMTHEEERRMVGELGYNRYQSHFTNKIIEKSLLDYIRKIIL